MSSDNEFVLRPGLCVQLESAFERNGWTLAEVNEVTKGDTLKKFLGVVRNHTEIKSIEHLIDCDAAPIIPDGYNWTVEEHQKGGQFKWNITKTSLYLSKQQNGDKWIEGNKLRVELKGKPVLNANVLDYLLKHPHLIPDEWKGEAVCFWGTIYRSADGSLYVRYLYWNGTGWDWNDNWLDDDWDADDPAVLAQLSSFLLR